MASDQQGFWRPGGLSDKLPVDPRNTCTPAHVVLHPLFSLKRFKRRGCDAAREREQRHHRQGGPHSMTAECVPLNPISTNAPGPAHKLCTCDWGRAGLRFRLVCREMDGLRSRRCLGLSEGDGVRCLQPRACCLTHPTSHLAPSSTVYAEEKRVLQEPVMTLTRSDATVQKGSQRITVG